MIKQTKEHPALGGKRPGAQQVWREYQQGVSYNNTLGLYETVKTNENFFLGRQWEGLNAPDLEKPVLNFLKRVVTFFISILVSDDVGVDLRFFHPDEDSRRLAAALSNEVERVIERTCAKSLNRDALRNAAVDGDCCFFLRFDPELESGQEVKGEIAIDLVENTNLIFGNPYISGVQDQPYIIIVKRMKLSSLQEELYREGFADWDLIVSDYQTDYYNEDKGEDNDLVTVLIRLWRDPDTKTIHYAKYTQEMLIKEPVDLGYRLYPISWMNWERVKNSFHGQAAITPGVIQNQIYVNTLWALFMIHQKMMAFPKLFYDTTKIDKWTNKVGQAIGVVGNPNEAVASAFRAPDFSSQAMALVEKTIQYTKEFMGANDASLGTVEAKNASAIIALQKAASAPLELQRLSFFQFVEDYVRIIADMTRSHYGVRTISYENPDGDKELLEVDFSQLNFEAMELNVEVGSSAYWSELMQIETSDSLFEKHIIEDAVTYLEMIPDRYVKNKQKIINRLKKSGEGAALGEQFGLGGVGELGQGLEGR